MSQPATVAPLTVGSLARDLATQAGRPMEALRCYESLAALWVRSCDTGLPCADALREETWRAARHLAAGQATVIAPKQGTIPGPLAGDESIVRLPASLAVQGVEWPDLIALAKEWLDTRASAAPVLVVGVRTGGAYLAPLVAARLATAGFDVRLSSVRSGEPHRSGNRRVLLVDDPPLTCRTLLDLVHELDSPAGVEALVPVFAASDVQLLRDAGIPVTVLPRERWQSTRRLDRGALSAYLNAHTIWPSANHRMVVEGITPGRENSALTPWPGVRRRSPARAAIHLRTSTGVRRAVAGWVPPGIFGDGARAVATRLVSPVPPATLAVAPALVVTEDITPASSLGPGGEHVEEAVAYVLARARQLPLTPTVGGPIPSVLRTVAQALAGLPGEADARRLHRLMSVLGRALPDNRCEAEKWVIDDAGGLRKTGYLTHAYRRDNELLTPLVDLAAISVTFGCGLHALAELLGRRLPGDRSWITPLAVALLCYGTARGEQLPRTYNPQRAAETAVEAYRLQRGMADAARVLLGSAPAPYGPAVVHRWPRPPAALVQPLLPFGEPPAESAHASAGPETEETVTAWANGQFLPVRDGTQLLLAPLGPPLTWPRAVAALEDLAEQLPRPGLLTWCGVPVVSLEAPDAGL